MKPRCRATRRPGRCKRTVIRENRPVPDAGTENPGSGVRLEGKGLDPRLLVFHGDDGQYHAIDNRCTHMGRRIDTIAGSGTIQCCSVSKSTFTYDGQPVGEGRPKSR